MDWIQALVSTRSLFPSRSLNYSLSLVPNHLSISTERLKKRLVEEGINENLVKDCEQIMLSEFSEIQGQLRVLCEERSNLLDTLRQLEVTSDTVSGLTCSGSTVYLCSFPQDIHSTFSLHCHVHSKNAVNSVFFQTLMIQ